MKDERITLRISTEERELLSTIAKLNNTSVSGIIRSLIREWIMYISQKPEVENFEQDTEENAPAENE